MTEPPRSYTGRRAVIAEKLEPFFHVSSLVPTNTEPAFEPELFENSLTCSWGNPATGENKLLVYIHRVPDGEREAEKVREMMSDEAPPEPNRQTPDVAAYEITDQRQGQYVFVLNYVGRLTAIVGNCLVNISPIPESIPMNGLADAALDIGRTVGCSAYINDFKPPTFGNTRAPERWMTADGLIYDPRTPPQP